MLKDHAPSDLQLPFRQWGAVNVYLLSKAENPIAVMGGCKSPIKSKPLLIAKLLSIWILAASGLHDCDIVQENVLFKLENDL